MKVWQRTGERKKSGDIRDYLSVLNFVSFHIHSSKLQSWIGSLCVDLSVFLQRPRCLKHFMEELFPECLCVDMVLVGYSFGLSPSVTPSVVPELVHIRCLAGGIRLVESRKK